MEYTFNKETRYITRGVNSEIPMEIQLLIWNSIDERVKSDEKTDYLQVFKFRVEDSGVFSIIHTQEQPEYKKEISIMMKEQYSSIIGKTIFVIDDMTHSTALLAREY
jgi:hypothetical protein